MASPHREKESLKIYQDAKVYLANLEEKRTIKHEVDRHRHLWVQVISGKIKLQGQTLKSGDGVAISEERMIEIMGEDKPQILLFDLS